MKCRKTILNLVLIAGAALVASACASLLGGPIGNRSPPQPAKAVDLARYAGLWFELARYDNRFERNCEAVTANYRLRSDGMVDVVNRCRKGGLNGALTSIRGVAKAVQGSRGAKLKVSFFGPFAGDYWVMDHADDYSWSIVGEPSGRFLWILTRSAHPGPTVGENLKARATALGYNTDLLRATVH